MEGIELQKQQSTLTYVKGVNKKIASMLLPITLENLLQMVAGIVTMGMIGRIDALSISAVGISMRITQIIWALFRGITIGATVFVAQYYGADRMDRVRDVVKQTLLASIVVVAVLQLIIFTQASRLLLIFNPQPELLALATQYIRIVSFGLPFLAVMLVIGGVLQGMGNAKTPMFITMSMNIVNLTVGYVVIFGRLGLSPLGVRGAAVATVVSQAVAASLGLFIVFRKGGVLGGCLNRDFFRFDRKQITSIFRIGLPSSMESIFWQLAAIILTRAILTFGETSFAAYQLGLQAESISYMPAMGFGVVATALIGQALGAKDKDLGRLYLTQILKGTVVITSVSTVVLVFFPRAIMAMLTNNIEIIAISSIYLIAMGLVQFPQNITGVLAGAMRGAGYTKVTMMVAGVGLWGVRVPLTLLMTYVFKFSIVSIWVVISVDLIFRFVVCYLYYKRKNIYESKLVTNE